MFKSLMGSFGEVLRIEDDKYYILSEDQECFQEVDFERFVKEYKKFENLYNTTWSKEFKEEYEAIGKELSERR